MQNLHPVYERMKNALAEKIKEYHLENASVKVRCEPLSAVEAIGNPEEQDYPIIRGKESIVEAEFNGAKGQAFSDSFGNRDYTLTELLDLPLTDNRQRADFVASLNAVYCHLGLCERTIHCRDQEPQLCAKKAESLFTPGTHVLLIGLQPRFLQQLSSRYNVRCVDMDPDNIGTQKHGIVIESPDVTPEIVPWCDVIFATGSTLVNGTLPDFLNVGKIVIFYGVTVAAAAEILNIPRYCEYGH